jgi:hypothetical protein
MYGSPTAIYRIEPKVSGVEETNHLITVYRTSAEAIEHLQLRHRNCKGTLGFKPFFLVDECIVLNSSAQTLDFQAASK